MKILKGNIFSYLEAPQLLSLAEIGAIGALRALKIANLATDEGKKFYSLAMASKKVSSHKIDQNADHKLLQEFSNKSFLDSKASLIIASSSIGISPKDSSWKCLPTSVLCHCRVLIFT